MVYRKPAKKLRPVNSIVKAVDKINFERAVIQDTLNSHTPYDTVISAVRSLISFRIELDKVGYAPFSYGPTPNTERIELILRQAKNYLDLFDSPYFPPRDFCTLHVDPTDQIQRSEQLYASVCADWKSGKIKKGLLDYVFSPTDSVPDQVKSHSEHIKRVREYAPKILPLVDSCRPQQQCVDRFVTENAEPIGKISTLKSKLYSLEKELKVARQFERQHGNTLAITARAKSQTRTRVGDLQHLVELTSDCPYCGGVLGLNPHLDHIHPVSCGGLSVLENLVWACQKCNVKKSNKTVLEFCEAADFELRAVVSRLRSLGKRV